MVVVVVVVGVGLAVDFFLNSIGDRLGDRPFPVARAVKLDELAHSFSGDGDEPVPVAEFLLEVANPTVVSK